MSAFIVTKKHIDLLVTAAMGSMGSMDPNAVGQMLWSENFLSVNARYAEKALPPPYRFTRFLGAVDAVGVLKAIQSLQYQSCEHDGWKDSKAASFLDDLTRATVCTLPGYNAAPWAID
jgi:hypothetical protein